MKTVGLFLARFQNLVPIDAETKLAVIEVLDKRLGLKLVPHSIKVDRRGIYLQVSSVIKNLVFLHREAIIEDLARRLKLKEQSIL